MTAAVVSVADIHDLRLAEERRLDEVAGTELRSRWLAAVSDDLRTGALAVVDLRLHLAKLGLVDDRAHPHALLEAIAGAPGLGLAGEELIELVEDRTQHDRAARRRAALPGGAERATRDGLGGLFEISVVHDDDRVLPAHLELDLAEALRSLRVEASPHRGRPREGDRLDALIRGDRARKSFARAQHQVERTVRQACRDETADHLRRA